MLQVHVTGLGHVEGRGAAVKGQRDLKIGMQVRTDVSSKLGGSKLVADNMDYTVSPGRYVWDMYGARGQNKGQMLDRLWGNLLGWLGKHHAKFEGRSSKFDPSLASYRRNGQKHWFFPLETG